MKKIIFKKRVFFFYILDINLESNSKLFEESNTFMDQSKHIALSPLSPFIQSVTSTNHQTTNDGFFFFF